MALQIKLIKVLKKSDQDKVNIYAHPEVTARLCSDEMDMVETLETTFGKQIAIRSENNYHVEQYEIFS